MNTFIVMERNKQVECKLCFKTMRSDYLDRHYQNKHILGYFPSYFTKETKIRQSREKRKVSQPHHTSTNTQILTQRESDDINVQLNYVKVVVVMCCCCCVLFCVL